MNTLGKTSIEIDGSYGEGGGQILRTALAFSTILHQPVIIHHIRAGRKDPGLKPQHFKTVDSLAQMTGAQVEGLNIGSQQISFFPKGIFPGEYQFEIGTAGSVTLLLQGLLLPICLSEGKSQLILMGGTHVPWSPPYHYFSEVLFPTLRLMGISVETKIEQWGWYPKGGGIIRAKINPVSGLKPIVLCKRGSLKKIRGLSATSNLPLHVAQRQKEDALRRIEKDLKIGAEISVINDVPGRGPGSFFFLAAEFERTVAGFSSLGERGKRAEEVSKEAVDSLRDYIDSDGCIDPHLADQLLPWMAFAKGHSSFTTTRISDHMLTNLWVIQKFFNIEISKSGEKGGPGRVEFFNG